MDQNIGLLSEDEFLDLIVVGFKAQPKRLADSGTENELQVDIANLLFDVGFKVFCEYSYLGSDNDKEKCDLAITAKSDHLKVTRWIELKPLWRKENSSYWRPSKFFGDAPFRKDVEKLAAMRKNLGSDNQRFWFLVVMTTDEPKPDANASNAIPGKALSPSQVRKAITIWSDGCEPLMRQVEYGTENCYLLLWQVQNYAEKLLKPDNGEYVLR